MKSSRHNYVYTNMRDTRSPTGRGEYCLRRPNEFSVSGGQAQSRGQTDPIMSKQLGQRLPDQNEIQNAATTLQNLLPRQSLERMKEPGGGVRRLPTSHQSPPPPPAPAPAPAAFPVGSEVAPPYRTTPLVLPHAKTIHSVGEQGNRFLTPSGTQEESQPPYRTSSLIMPGPRTIHEVRGGGPTFTPYRGPQYYADKGFTPLPLPTITQHSPHSTRPLHPLQLYNSPVHLYSDQALAEALNKPVALTGNGTAAPREKYQLPAKTGGAPNINQSSSFKKVMYSVMRDSEF